MIDRGTSFQRLGFAFTDRAYAGALLTVAVLTVGLWCVYDILVDSVRSDR